jgi:hypothetical protein
MKKQLFQFAALCFALSGTTALAETSIRILGNTADSARFSRIIRNRLVLQDPNKYHKIISSVAVVGDTEELTLQLLSNEIYLLETVKMTIRRNTDEVIALNRNIRIIDRQLLFGCPDETVDFVMSTPVDEITTAREGVENACLTATNRGYKCRVLLGDQASVMTYKRYLSCKKLKGFGNIGHGNTNAIALADGSLTNTWFDAVADNHLNGKVLYFNSCQVHNPLLEPAVMGAGSRTYIGGNVNLLIGPSENVFKCFWDKVIGNSKTMGTALSECEAAKYPTTGAHGISGFTGFFSIPIIIRTPIPFPPIPPLPVR